MVALISALLVVFLGVGVCLFVGSRRPIGTPLTWGEAMVALISDVRQGRPGDGICAAIERVGVVLADHFPRSATDTNEIPDKLIEL